MNARILPLLALAVAAAAALPVSGCGGSEQQTQAATTPAVNTSTFGSDDAAARLAAQTLLKNAQTAEESYLAAHGTYAASTTQLKNADPRLSSRVNVTSGNSSGYQISITAGDSEGTTFTIRKSGDRTTYLDNNGNPW